MVNIYNIGLKNNVKFCLFLLLSGSSRIGELTTAQMVSMSLIWQLEHIGKGADVFAEPPSWFS